MLIPPRPLPEIFLDEDLAREIDAVGGSFETVEEAERVALNGDIAASLSTCESWIPFREQVQSFVRTTGYAVVRGLNADGGRSLMVASRALGLAFDTYRPGRVVKRFRMSPWTHELSHTTRAGDFHTDGNVSPTPPVATALQCEVEDPGAPEFAEQRVVYLPDLLERLAAGDDEDAAALSFLTEADAVMGSERVPELWRGRLVENGTIRYHPQSLRVGNRRLGRDAFEVEPVIAAVHRAAIDVSIPFHTRPGDTVLVSNRRALHYRGECSVRFTRFPTDFEARSLFVLHMRDSAA